MKKLLSILLACLFTHALLAQGGTTREYYDYQRSENFRKYMENVSSQGSGLRVSAGNWSVNPQALQELADAWGKARGRKTAEQIAREKTLDARQLEAKRLEDAGNAYRQQQAAIERNAVASATDSYAMSMIGDLTKDGFQGFEAMWLGLRWVKGSYQKDGKLTMAYGSKDEVADKVWAARAAFTTQLATARFEELLELIDNFGMAGYSALQALKKLEKRFPEKAAALRLLQPYYGTNFWLSKVSHWGKAPSPIAADYYALENVKGEMEDNLLDWIRNLPGSTLYLLKSQGGSRLFDNLFLRELKAKRLDNVKALYWAGINHLPEWTGGVRQYYKSYPELKTLFSKADFDLIAKARGISGMAAIELVVGSSFEQSMFEKAGALQKWTDGPYLPELKAYGLAGDMQALNAYALLTRLGLTADPPDAAPKMLKKVLDAGLPYPLAWLKVDDYYKKMGIDDPDRYTIEFEFNDRSNQYGKFLASSGAGFAYSASSKLTDRQRSQRMVIPPTAGRKEGFYYYGDLQNGMANGYGEAVSVDGTSYRGQWKNNLFDGEGYLIEETWDTYKGSFVGGKKQGRGFASTKKGKKIDEGFFYEDKFVGKEMPKSLLPADWQKALDRFKWDGLETAATDATIHRYLSEKGLAFCMKTKDYAWTIAPLEKAPSTFVYEVGYDIGSPKTTQGEFGLLMDLKDGPKEGKTKLIFLFHPQSHSLYFGMFDPVSGKWTNITAPQRADGWATYKTAGEDAKQDGSQYKIALKKGADAFFLYIDDQLVFTQPFASVAQKAVGPCDGIGLIQGAMGCGTVTSIQFRE